MNVATRYDIEMDFDAAQDPWWSAVPSASGEYVLAADYEALAARVAELEEDVARFKRYGDHWFDAYHKRGHQAQSSDADGEKPK